MHGSSITFRMNRMVILTNSGVAVQQASEVHRQRERPIYHLSRLLCSLPGSGGDRTGHRSALNYAIELTMATSITQSSAPIPAPE
jgi:hypothetical protein